MTILTYFAILSIIVLFLYVSRETVCLCVERLKIVQNLFDFMFHVEHYEDMNTFEEVPFPSEDEIAGLMKRYRYNIVQMKTMQEL